MDGEKVKSSEPKANRKKIEILKDYINIRNAKFYFSRFSSVIKNYIGILILFVLIIFFVIIYVSYTIFPWDDFKLHFMSIIAEISLSGFIIAKILNYKQGVTKKEESVEIIDQVLGNSLDLDSIIQDFMYDYFNPEEKSTFSLKQLKINKMVSDAKDIQSKLRYYQFIFDEQLLKKEIRAELRWLDQCISSLSEDLKLFLNCEDRREYAWSHRGLYLSFRNINDSLVKLCKINGRSQIKDPEYDVATRYIADFKRQANKLLIEHGYENNIV